MKLFLSSEGIPSELRKDFLSLVGKPANEITLTFIENAADPYLPESNVYLDVTKKTFADIGLAVEKTDLRKFSDADKIYKHLSKFDVIWCSGGNTWYLRYLIRKSGFETAIGRLIEKGKIYCGDSAGAIIATPTLKYAELIDEQDKAPEVIYDGLKLVDFAIVPHWGNEKIVELLEKMRDSLVSDGYDTKTISDDQAIVVADGKVKVIG